MIAGTCLRRASWPLRFPIASRRWISASSLGRRLSEPVQSYISSSRDPFLNLSVEQHILQKSAPESAILFLYINSPCVVIGRNQNPWLEANLALLDPSQRHPEDEGLLPDTVELIRRRSGGGTVFHDGGNVNWSVICPAADFTRDKHAEMVVRSLRSCGVDRARVNERHDIVLDQGEHIADTDLDDTHVTPYTRTTEDGPRPLKVSGSAYKLTRGRALHHGTCLLSSPNLDKISAFLRSPAKPYIKARGVESVSSPVTNVNLSSDQFIRFVQEQFSRMYHPSYAITATKINDTVLDIPDIAKEYAELQTPEWKYLQTPQFTLSNTQTTSPDSTRSVDIALNVRHGVITDASIKSHRSHDSEATVNLEQALQGQQLHDLSDHGYNKSWRMMHRLYEDDVDDESVEYALRWIERVIPMYR